MVLPFVGCLMVVRIMENRQRIGLIQRMMSILSLLKQLLQTMMRKRLRVPRLNDRRVLLVLLVRYLRVHGGVRRLWIRGFTLRDRFRLWWKTVRRFERLYILVPPAAVVDGMPQGRYSLEISWPEEASSLLIQRFIDTSFALSKASTVSCTATHQLTRIKGISRRWTGAAVGPSMWGRSH
jgi:hypothetical protein